MQKKRRGLLFLLTFLLIFSMASATALAAAPGEGDVQAKQTAHNIGTIVPVGGGKLIL